MESHECINVWFPNQHAMRQVKVTPGTTMILSGLENSGNGVLLADALAEEFLWAEVLPESNVDIFDILFGQGDPVDMIQP